MEEYLKKRFILELEQVIQSLKTKQIVDCECWFCGKVKQLTVKQVKRKLVEISDGYPTGVFCDQACFSAYKHIGRACPVHDCVNCGKRIQEDRFSKSIGKNNFCGHSCSATYTNKGKIKQEATKEKIRSTLSFKYGSYCKLPKNFFSGLETSTPKPKRIPVKRSKDKRPRKPRKADGPYCRFEFVNCKYCKELFTRISGSCSKFCSDVCRTKSSSEFHKERLSKAENRTNLGRHKPSYMERTFSEWLDSNGVEYRTEVQFKNHDLNKYYYADFVFDQFLLIIELDGNHHKGREELDRIRDGYLKSYYGYEVLRITHKEYIKQTKLDLVKSLLNIT